MSHEHVLHSATLLRKSVETSESKWPDDATAANKATWRIQGLTSRFREKKNETAVKQFWSSELFPAASP